MEIPITKPAVDFDQHLATQENERIIFSAKFGNGKTYFLKKFFENNPSYDAIHLFPIKYSVASNEDIFELIKYDVLFNLLGKDVEFEKINIPHIDTLLSFAGNNAHEIIAPFIKLIPSLGNSVFSIYEKLYSLYNDYLKAHEAIQINEEQKAIEYLRSFTQVKGNIYEEDFFTQLIKDLVNQLKKTIEGTVENKKTVLIIDDLDRIDPDHIFRILNVFSAHFDVDKNGNKFDFDKIILVCDIVNIRKIFSNRFGADVDFTGYIDKFYSKEVFLFDNRDLVVESINDVLNTIVLPKNFANLSIFKPQHPAMVNLSYILCGFIYYDAINLRTIVKLENTPYNPKIYQPKLPLISHRYTNNSFDILLIIDFLFYLFSDIDQIIEACDKCKIFTTKSYDVYTKSSFPRFILPLLDIEQHQFKSNDEQAQNTKFTYTIENVDISYSPRIFRNGFNDNYQCNISTVAQKSKPDESPADYDYFLLLKKLLVKIKKENIIPL